MNPESLSFTKHHGLGNDFLVLVDLDEHVGVDDRAALARAVCDRHRGIGADGLLFALRAPADGSAQVTMRLHNADGSVAEMSGNGIRCFAQAAIGAGIIEPGAVQVSTDAGVRSLEAGATDRTGLARVRVAMGTARINTIDVPRHSAAMLDGGRYCTVDIGNPHLVIDRPMRADAPAALTAAYGATLANLEEPFLATPTKGINVEAIWRSLAEAETLLSMRVWERGVGLTEACGTGACAAAVVARAWGWCQNRVTVRQPGGDADVELDGDEVTLIGPTQYIGRIEFPWWSV